MRATHQLLYPRMIIHDSGQTMSGGLLGESSSTSERPVSFSLGTGLVLLLIVGISAVISLCYHWKKLIRREMRISAFLHGNNVEAVTPAIITSRQHSLFPENPPTSLKMVAALASRPALMPGDEMPKFIAWPCPQVDAAPPSKQNKVQEEEEGEACSREPKSH